MSRIKLTKKQVYEIVELTYYYSVSSEDQLHPLCGRLNHSDINLKWYLYWKKINTKRYILMSAYFEEFKVENFTEDRIILRNLLRLLTLCMFIEDTYK